MPAARKSTTGGSRPVCRLRCAGLTQCVVHPLCRAHTGLDAAGPFPGWQRQGGWLGIPSVRPRGPTRWAWGGVKAPSCSRGSEPKARRAFSCSGFAGSPTSSRHLRFQDPLSPKYVPCCKIQDLGSCTTLLFFPVWCQECCEPDSVTVALNTGYLLACLLAANPPSASPTKGYLPSTS